VFTQVWRFADKWAQSRGSTTAWLVLLTRSSCLHFRCGKTWRKKAMKVLTPAQKNSLELAFFGDLTHQQITESLGEPLGTVKSSIRGAMIRLKNELEGMWP